MRGPSSLLSLLIGVTLVPILSGCLSPSTPNAVGPAASEEPKPTSGTIGDLTKEPLPASANQELGALRGNTLSKSGGVIQNARVLLLGLDRQTQANEYGAFAFNDVAPGEVTLRAEAAHYLAAEVQLVVEKGFLRRLNVSLEPEDPNNMEHVHDYWFVDGKPVTSRVLIDGKADFPWSVASGGEQKVVCVPPDQNDITADGGDELDYNNVGGGEECQSIPIYFEGEGPVDGIIWPGTKELAVTISWATLNPEILPSVQLKYKPANTTSATWPPKISFERGDTKKIDVAPNMADTGHQRWTMWRFWIVVNPQVSGKSLPVQGDVIRRLVGSFDVKIEAVKGVLPVEEAHPHYWAQGKRLVLADNATRRIGGDPAAGGRRGNGVYDRNATQDFSPIAFTLPEGKIVPPGTTHLRVILRYQDSLAIPPEVNTLKSLGFRSAGLNPARATLTDLKDPDHTNPRGITTWYFKLDDAKDNDETDPVYSKASSWLFLLANEGEEQGARFIDEASVVGYTDFWLTVEAVNENWEKEFAAGII